MRPIQAIDNFLLLRFSIFKFVFNHLVEQTQVNIIVIILVDKHIFCFISLSFHSNGRHGGIATFLNNISILYVTFYTFICNKGTSVLKLANVNKLPFFYFWSFDFGFLILCWKWDILKEYLFSWWSDNPLTMNPFTLTTKESMIILHRQSHKSSIYMFFFYHCFVKVTNCQ